jgi:hypothetical protein
MEPNDRDFGAIDARLPKQVFDHHRVRLGHQLIGFGEAPKPRPSVGERGDLGERRP